MKTPLIVGNWKMNKTVPEAIRLITELKSLLSGKQDAEIVVAPPYVSLHPAEIAAQGTPIKIAAQDVYFEDNGAYTGEIACSMLIDIGCAYVIIGHSERRKHFEESNAVINKKVRAALENALFPILCVGETKEQREAKETFEVIETQLREGVRGITDAEAENLVVAYEPVWAIGTGVTATPGQAAEVHKFIEEKLTVLFRRDVGQGIRMLYGGSVTPDNVKDLMAQPGVDGVLVGGASLDAKKFVDIVNYGDR